MNILTQDDKNVSVCLQNINNKCQNVSYCTKALVIPVVYTPMCTNFKRLGDWHSISKPSKYKKCVSRKER